MAKSSSRKILVADSSLLAKNMYRLLFSNVGPYEFEYVENLSSFPKSKHDLLLINSNVIPKESKLLQSATCPVILLCSKSRFDLIEAHSESSNIFIIKKPFFPYALLSEVNQLLGAKRALKKRKASR